MKHISKLQFITQDIDGLSHLDQIKQAIDGGCNWVQLRMKNQSFEKTLDTAQQAREITIQSKTTLIINDNVDIAKMVKADGVHLGKNDMNPTEARAVLGNDYIIGATANTIDDIERLNQMPIDYLGVGPFKFTKTKKNLSPILGLPGYKEIVKDCRTKNINLPMVAIGSVTQEYIEPLLNTGMFGVAVSSAIAKSQNPTLASKQLIKTIATFTKG